MTAIHHFLRARLIPAVAVLPLGLAPCSIAAIIHVPGDYPTIQAALNVANNGDEIVVADGTHSGSGFYDVDFNGLLVTVRSASGDPNLCTLDCQMMGRGFIFDSGETADAIVEGFTIANGVAGEGGGFHIDGAGPTIRDCIILDCFGDVYGGGVYITGGIASLIDCTFTGCFATNAGGAVYGYEGGASPITGCTFQDNWTYGRGGALYSVVDWQVTLSQSTFTNNSAGDDGGAVFHGHNTLNIDGCTFTGNYITPGVPADGGAVYVSNAWLNVTGSTFSYNSATDGGAIAADSAIIDVTDTLFDGNTSSSRGGAACLTGPSISTFAGCEFLANESLTVEDHQGGGAIFHSEGDLAMTGCTFEMNTARRLGGALYNTDGDAALTDCTFTANSTEIASHPEHIGGGAIANILSADIILTGCTFQQNVSADSAGAVFVRDGGTVIISDCTFQTNQALEAWSIGGAIRAVTAEALQISDSTFTGNSSDAGGAISAYASDFATAIVRCRFEQNASLFEGGAVRAGTSEIQIVDCTFIENTGGNRGGAVYLSYTAPIPTLLTNCRFHGNTAVFGGALFTYDDVHAANCLFAGNVGRGAIHIYDGQSVFVNCTLWANDLYGIALDADHYQIQVELDNSILWANVAGQIEYWYWSIITLDYCDIEGGWTGNGSNNIDLDPLFADPDGPDNIPGTADDNLRLAPLSPCIDAADNTSVPPDTLDLDGDGNTTEPIPFDLDGEDRFVDDPATPDTGNGTPPIVDMGAYEFQTCPADINNDEVVDVLDLLALLAAWGNTSGPEDVNHDGIVDVLDLLILLGTWGPCP